MSAAVLDLAALRRFTDTLTPRVAPPVSCRLLAGGRSNLTYRIEDETGRHWVLRRPPLGVAGGSAHDMSREWDFLGALHPAGLPVPRPIAYCADPEVIGAEFYVMEYVDGAVLATVDDTAELDVAGQARFGDEIVDALVALQQQPPEKQLQKYLRRTDYVSRQLRGLGAQLRQQTHEPAGLLLVEIGQRLDEHRPAQRETCIVHGDFRTGNAIFGPDGRLRALLDWELATTGDPFADLGWLLSSWWAAGEHQLLGTRPGASAAPHARSRTDLVGRYADATGRDVSNLPYWTALAQWRLAAISLGVKARYLAGRMGDSTADVLAQARDQGAAAERLALAARDQLGLLGH